MIELDNITQENIDSIIQEDVMDLPYKEFLIYRNKCTELGYKYMYNGISQASPILYATSKVRLARMRNNSWDVSHNLIIPSTTVAPIMLNKEKFTKLMLAHGVSDELLTKFFKEDENGSANWDNE